MTKDELCRLEQSELVKLIDEGQLVYLPTKNELLKSQLTEATKLLKLAENDINNMHSAFVSLTKDIYSKIGGEYKCYCCVENKCNNCGCGDNWRWQYSDRYEKLKSEVKTQ